MTLNKKNQAIYIYIYIFLQIHFNNITEQICVSLRDCLNSSSLNDAFPNELVLVDATSLRKQHDPGNKRYYQPINVSP